MKRNLIAIAAAAAFLITGAQYKPAQADDGRQMIGILAGAAVGGLVGSHMGKGDGRLVATAAGTLIGAGVGGMIASDNEPVRTKRVKVIERETVYRDRNYRYDNDDYYYDDDDRVYYKRSPVVKKVIVEKTVVHVNKRPYGQQVAQWNRNKHHQWKKHQNKKWDYRWRD